MTEHTKVTQAGEVVLSKHLLQGRGWAPGTELEVEETPQGVLIRVPRPKAPAERISYEEFRRRVPKYEGPPVSLEDMQNGIDQAMAERWARKEANSR
ncbi:MAG TPA: AbrB/MazE/SpoVT family DNA-binding domain-containing protein [Allosphingosinicella sp.]|jgi:bifunctional DNA-binding transcriptional regulator/antitoxin component of YhaV-PrlF toxin-antitoxin module